MRAEPIPAAVTAAIQGVLEDTPYAPAWRQAELVVRELQAQGWRITPPHDPRHREQMAAAQGVAGPSVQGAPVRPSLDNS